MTNKEFAKQLRVLATLYQKNATLKQPSNPTFYMWASDKEQVAEFIKCVGAVDKSYTEHYVTVTAKACPLLKVQVSRGEVCTAKVVGTRRVEARYIPAFTEPAHDEDVVEWECGPILG